MATYEQLCGCIVEIEKGVTRTTTYCDQHGSLSFGGAWQGKSEIAARGAADVQHIPLAAPADVSPFGVPTKGKSLLGTFADKLFGDIEINSIRPGALIEMDAPHSHTLCDEQVDFLNLTLSRQRLDLLTERRGWVIQRKKDPVAGQNRITEIDAEIEMIDGITLKLRRQS